MSRTHADTAIIRDVAARDLSVWFASSLAACEPSSRATMLKIGLTGGIASGKSLVSRIFTELGAHSIDADEIAHELMRPGESVYDEVVQKFGNEVVNPDKTVNRARLAELAFDK